MNFVWLEDYDFLAICQLTSDYTIPQQYFTMLLAVSQSDDCTKCAPCVAEWHMCHTQSEYFQSITVQQEVRKVNMVDIK